MLQAKKKINPMEALVRSGVAIKLLIGDNAKVQHLMAEVNTKNKDIQPIQGTSQTATGVRTALAAKHTRELENVEEMLLKQIEEDREAALAMGKHLQI